MKTNKLEQKLKKIKCLSKIRPLTKKELAEYEKAWDRYIKAKYPSK